VTVLVIDDDDGVRDAILDVLAAEGVKASGVSTAAEAFTYLETQPLPRLILLDLVLPDMTGGEVRNRLLADTRLAEIPVIVMSASSAMSSDVSVRALAGKLRKPFELDALLGLVQRFGG
jgi:CheY-like chemotaxis protein